jgi:hypothetical protein
MRRIHQARTRCQEGGAAAARQAAVAERDSAEEEVVGLEGDCRLDHRLLSSNSRVEFGAGVPAT